MAKRYAYVNKRRCVACGACENVCPKSAIAVYRGMFAKVDGDICVGCGICEKPCPAGAITIRSRADERMGLECDIDDAKRGACPMCAQLATSIPCTPEIHLPKKKRK